MSKASSRFAAACFVLVAMLACSQSTSAAGEITREQLDFFEKRIRPVLVERCYECHASEAKKIQGGLLLDSREGLLTGGDSGPAIVPNDTADSLLIQALHYEAFEMPPKGKLPNNIIADFEKWVRMGAPDPRDKAIVKVRQEIDFDKAREFWSFVPLKLPKIAAVQNADWPSTEIDRFILARVEANGLTPAPNTDRRKLIRRLYFDLIGMPPSVEEIDAFVNDDSAEAYEELIDRLLDSRHFGERWGRHWLDVVRFAESTGGGRTKILRNAWRFRDYVIQSLNDDKPFDQFIVEHIAGDLMPYETLDERSERLTGTGFLALGTVQLRASRQGNSCAWKSLTSSSTQLAAPFSD